MIIARLRRVGDIALPKIVLAPTAVAAIVFIYGFIAWTIWMSLTSSTLLPNNDFIGLNQYIVLFSLPTWWTSLINLGIFSVIYILACLAIGLTLAILIDQKIRGEGWLRMIFLYPLALALAVTGVVWQWLLNPALGFQQAIRSLGWDSFTFNWIIQPDMAIYTVIIAAVWQASGFIMTIFLAGLRTIDDSVLYAAQLDGASLPRAYLRIIIPSLRSTCFSAVVLLVALSIKSFDLIIAMTGGGPGYSTWMPAIFMYEMSFNRGLIALGAASAVMMMLAIAIVMVPMLISEIRQQRKINNA